MNKLTAKARASHILELTFVSPLSRIVHNYFNHALVKYLELRNANKTQKKSEARFTAERSLREKNALPFFVALTHYELGTCGPQIVDIEYATAGI